MTNSTSKNLVLNLISSKDSYYSFSSINQELKKENKIIFNQKKWSKINVINTNNCLISVCKTKYKNKIIILSAIDNLIKGGAGQAVQNLNNKFNFPEKTGLK